MRDATAQAGHYLNDEPVDETVLALSTAGIGLSGAVLATGGGAIALKTGVSLAKLAHRTGKMTKGFSQGNRVKHKLS